MKNTNKTKGSKKAPPRGCLASGKKLETYLRNPKDSIIVQRGEPRHETTPLEDRMGALLD